MLGLGIASSAGISPDESGGGKFSKPIRRLEPIERPAEEARLGILEEAVSVKTSRSIWGSKIDFSHTHEDLSLNNKNRFHFTQISFKLFLGAIDVRSMFEGKISTYFQRYFLNQIHI
jgi:hypothetical protein